MANWKKYKIAGISNNPKTWIRFYLDDYVIYERGGEKYINCAKEYPFCNWEQGEYIEIDNDKTRYKLCTNEFDISIVRNSDFASMALVKVNAEHSYLRRDYDSLQIEKRNLESKNSDLHREIQSLVRAGKEQLATKDRQIEQTNNQLVRVQNDRDDYKNKWILSGNEVKRVTDSFNALQIENTKKDDKINKQKEKIKELKGELNISREEFLDQKIHLKEERLETFTQQLGINLGKIWNLRNAYEDLLCARQECNRNNKRTAEEKINTVKQELLGGMFGGVGMANIQKVCRKCEKLAKVRLELEKVVEQKQYQAHQEQPTNN